LKHLIVFKDQEDEQKCLNGEVALTHSAINFRRKEKDFTWFFPKSCYKHQFTTVSIVEGQLFFTNNEQRVWEKPYRHLFQHCFRAVERASNPVVANKWASFIVPVFLRYNRTFPQTLKHSFLVYDSKRKGSPLSFHTTVHRQLEAGVIGRVEWSDLSLWEVGTENRFLAGETSHLDTLDASAVAKKVERALGPIGGRRLPSGNIRCVPAVCV